MSTSGSRSARAARRLVIPVVLVLAAGGAVVWFGLHSRVQTVRHGSVVVFVDGMHLFPPAGSAVAFSGRLVLVDGGCVGITLGKGRVDVLVWPRGTKVSGSGKDFRINLSGYSFHLGDRINYGSKKLSPSPSKFLPEGCSARVTVAYDVRPLRASDPQ